MDVNIITFLEITDLKTIFVKMLSETWTKATKINPQSQQLK
jgi:hypothetical protein